MDAPCERSLRVGHGLFDPLSGELRLDGRTVKLRPRTAAFLSHLVQHPDRVVGKDELMQAVWPDAVVTEDSLVQCVKEIRHALGETGRDWIRTVPRQGYAFIRAPADAPPPADSQPASVPPRAGHVPRWGSIASRWRQLGVLAIVLAAVAGALATREWRRSEPAAAAPPLSIVVMPVVNLTGDSTVENVTDDMTEALADALARTSGVAVIAPRTAFTFKGSPVDVQRIGKLLNVRYVLEGSLRLEASRPVLTMRLADASSAVQLWNQEFAPPDMPELRALVAGRVASALGLQLVRADAWAERHRTVSPKAMELFARARAVLRWSGKSAPAIAQARSLLEEAVRQDEGFSEAWAMLAFTWLNDVRFSPTREQDLQRAGEAMRRALALDRDNDGVRVVEGRLYYEQGRMAEALTAFESAAEMNPNNASALGFRGAALVMLGRPAEALEQIERAIRLSPRDPQIPVWQMFGGVAHLHRGEEAAAVEWLTRAVDGYPASPFGHLFLASALGAAGRIEDARVHMAQLQQMRPGFTLSRFRAVEPSDAAAFRAQRERVYEGLRRAGMPE